MTIATKSGGLIVKDGKLANGCGCCATWNCYQNCGTAICDPCGYTSAMPSTLRATLTLSLSSTVYVPRRGTAFGGMPEWSCYKITPENASSASGVFSLTREASTCIYSTTIESFRGAIRVRVGDSGSTRQVLGSNLWSCSSNCDSGMSVLSLSRWMACKGSVVSYGGASSIWRNAASLDYPYDTYAFLPGFTGFASATDTGDASVTTVCLSGFDFILANSRVSVTPCSSKPFSTIYGQFVFDLFYTDVTGATAVVNRILPAACTLVVEA